MNNVWIVDVEEIPVLSFDTQEEAIEHATDQGYFENCHSKECWCDRYDEIIFEVGGDKLEDVKMGLSNYNWREMRC